MSLGYFLWMIALLLPSGSGNEKSREPAAPKPAIVLELFTSQGCESCPSADALLSKLGNDTLYKPFVIPLSYHVDFWNSLGWKDPFSTRQFSARQLAYEAVLGMENFYTPQLIINGRAECVGSYEKRVREEIEWAMNGLPKARLTPRVVKQRNGAVDVQVTARVQEDIASEKLNLMLAVFENNLVTTVERGENRGKVLRNDHVIRILEEVGTLSGEAHSFFVSNVTINLEPEWQKENLGVAVFLQDTRSLVIHGATTVMLE